MRFAVFLCLFGYALSLDGPSASVGLSVYRGSTEKSANGREYFSFKGIRFAQPPIGELRFKSPVEFNPPAGDIQATEDGSVCPQPIILSNSIIGNEDCLFLNVYVPKVSKSEGELLPVMFWIHGGGYMLGSAHSMFHNPLRLMDKDVIIVAVNYRLGALGFLSTGDDVSKGNQGMLDQLLALQWTKKNIRSFGGDPDKITIFGNSAGSASVSLHLVSPLAKGLFSRAIHMAGNMYCDWSFQKDSLKVAQDLGKSTNCPIISNKELVDCLRKIDAKELTKKQADLTGANMFPILFSPVVDGHFLTKDPRDLLETGDINAKEVISGVAAQEGLLMALFMTEPIKKGMESESAFFNDFMPGFIPRISEFTTGVDELIPLVKNEYFSQAPFSDSKHVKRQFISFAGDITFNAPNAKFVRTLVERGINVYAYEFDHPKSNVKFNFIVKEDLDMSGTGHSMETFHLFASVYIKSPELNEVDRRVTDHLLEAWTAFALNGTPGSVWSPVEAGSSAIRYIEIGHELKMKHDDYVGEDKQIFWFETLREKHREILQNSQAKQEL